MPSAHVVVTGGSGGLGHAVIERLVERRGARCSVLDLDPDTSLDNDHVAAHTCDVTDQTAVENAVAAATDQFGPPTGLVATAGIASRDHTIDVAADKWRRIVAVHLDGSLFAAQAVARRMMHTGQGSIVFFCSVAMDFGVPGRAAYGAAKAAIGSLTRTLAVEWAPHHIRVNAIAPGDIHTPMYDVLEAQGVVDLDLVRAWHPIGRLGEPFEVAAVVDFLLSDDASFMTGEIVRVDGGFTAKKT